MTSALRCTPLLPEPLTAAHAEQETPHPQSSGTLAPSPCVCPQGHHGRGVVSIFLALARVPHGTSPRDFTGHRRSSPVRPFFQVTSWLICHFRQTVLQCIILIKFWKQTDAVFTSFGSSVQPANLTFALIQVIN